MLIYEGKAKKIYQTANDKEVKIYFKDDTTAFNGVKKAQIANKGALNLLITTHIFQYLEANGIKTHFLKQVDDLTLLARKVEIVPLEFICRNRVMGSMKKRLGFTHDQQLSDPVLEICYKNDELNDPLINDYHAIALGLCTKAQLSYMYDQTVLINQLLIAFFRKINIELADFKIEFGITADGTIMLADEISPDSCRLIDLTTNEQLDKDLFRLDTGDIAIAYQEVLDRISA